MSSVIDVVNRSQADNLGDQLHSSYGGSNLDGTSDQNMNHKRKWSSLEESNGGTGCSSKEHPKSPENCPSTLDRVSEPSNRKDFASAEHNSSNFGNHVDSKIAKIVPSESTHSDIDRAPGHYSATDHDIMHDSARFKSNNHSSTDTNYHASFSRENDASLGAGGFNLQNSMKIPSIGSLNLPTLASNPSHPHNDSQSSSSNSASNVNDLIALAKLATSGDARTHMANTGASFLSPLPTCGIPAGCGGTFSRASSSAGISSLQPQLSAIDILAASAFSRAPSSGIGLTAASPMCTFSRAPSSCGVPSISTPVMSLAADMLSAAGTFSRAPSASGPPGLGVGCFSRASSASGMGVGGLAGMSPLDLHKVASLLPGANAGCGLPFQPTGFSRAASAPGVMAFGAQNGFPNFVNQDGFNSFQRAASSGSVVGNDVFSRACSGASISRESIIAGAALAAQSRLANALDLSLTQGLQPSLQAGGLMRTPSFPTMSGVAGPSATFPPRSGSEEGFSPTQEGGSSGGAGGTGDDADSRSGRGKKGIRVEDPKKLAVDFATSVTVESSRGGDWVARNGDESLFSTLRRILPQVCQPGNGRHRLKGKIAGPEFNKLLQATCGFVCARTRKKSLALTAGNWLFCNRRWLNPADAEDRRALEQAYDTLCVKHPAFTSCTKSEFLQRLHDVCRTWNERI